MVFDEDTKNSLVEMDGMISLDVNDLLEIIWTDWWSQFLERLTIIFKKFDQWIHLSEKGIEFSISKNKIPLENKMIYDMIHFIYNFITKQLSHIIEINFIKLQIIF